MKIPEGFIVKETISSFSRGNVSKKYPFTLTFTPHVKYILKQYCHYRTFSFLHKTEDDVIRAISDMQIEIDHKYFKTKK